MTADYKTHGQRPEKKPLPGFVWLLIGLSIGLFVALIVYLDKQPANEVSFEQAIKRDLAKLRTPAETEKADPAAAEEKSSPDLKYTYHTILKELEVLIPLEELKLGSSANKDKVIPPAGNQQTLLQAGSFRSKQDADRLKAQIALLGMQANIESVTIRKDRWYRVRLGPYADSTAAYRELNLLKSNGITAMAFSIK